MKRKYLILAILIVVCFTFIAGCAGNVTDVTEEEGITEKHIPIDGDDFPTVCVGVFDELVFDSADVKLTAYYCPEPVWHNMYYNLYCGDYEKVLAKFFVGERNEERDSYGVEHYLFELKSDRYNKFNVEDLSEIGLTELSQKIEDLYDPETNLLAEKYSTLYYEYWKNKCLPSRFSQEGGEIVIPRELFEKDEGEIVVYIFEVLVKNGEEELQQPSLQMSLYHFSFNYIKDGDTITITGGSGACYNRGENGELVWCGKTLF